MCKWNEEFPLKLYPSDQLFCSTGPIASMFWLDEELCSDVFLDGKFPWPEKAIWWWSPLGD